MWISCRLHNTVSCFMTLNCFFNNFFMKLIKPDFFTKLSLTLTYASITYPLIFGIIKCHSFFIIFIILFVIKFTITRSLKSCIILYYEAKKSIHLTFSLTFYQNEIYVVLPDTNTSNISASYTTIKYNFLIEFKMYKFNFIINAHDKHF